MLAAATTPTMHFMLLYCDGDDMSTTVVNAIASIAEVMGICFVEISNQVTDGVYTYAINGDLKVIIPPNLALVPALISMHDFGILYNFDIINYFIPSSAPRQRPPPHNPRYNNGRVNDVPPQPPLPPPPENREDKQPPQISVEKKGDNGERELPDSMKPIVVRKPKETEDELIAAARRLEQDRDADIPPVITRIG